MRYLFLTAALLAAWVPARADDQPIPATRPAMKEVLEAWKQAQPRLPLPAPKESDRAKAGGRAVVNNGRMRQLYLPEELRTGDFARGADSAMTLDPTFKTMLFWIVSRVNHCRYCLGHQEWKLAGAGMSEDRVAALDFDWAEFTPAERAAFAFVRKLTYEPHAITNADFETLRKHYTGLQPLEIVFTAANNTATNRWTGALGIPQDGDGSFFGGKGKGEVRDFLTPTAEKYKDRQSAVAPTQTRVERPPLESRQAVEAALLACRSRTPRVALGDETKARALVPADVKVDSVPNWVRLVANFPVAGAGRVASLYKAERFGELPDLLKCQTAWIAARHDRAWYALGQAKRRLAARGLSEDAIYALDGKPASFTPAEQAAFAFVRKLTVAPGAITDDDIAGLRKHYTDKQVAELVLHTANASFFDRLTEACAVPLE